MALLAASCGTVEVRPYTRVEYQEYAFLPKDKDEYDQSRSQALYFTAGPSISYSTEYEEEGETYYRQWLNANLGVSAQFAFTEGDWSDYEPGVALSPDIMFWIDESQFLHLSMDFSFFGDGSTVFGFLAWEKTWE